MKVFALQRLEALNLKCTSWTCFETLDVYESEEVALVDMHYAKLLAKDNCVGDFVDFRVKAFELITFPKCVK